MGIKSLATIPNTKSTIQIAKFKQKKAQKPTVDLMTISMIPRNAKGKYAIEQKNKTIYDSLLQFPKRYASPAALIQDHFLSNSSAFALW